MTKHEANLKLAKIERLYNEGVITASDYERFRKNVQDDLVYGSKAESAAAKRKAKQASKQTKDEFAQKISKLILVLMLAAIAIISILFFFI